jgi:nicotinamidase-related amidase
MAQKQILPQIKGGPNKALLVIDVQWELFRQKIPIYQAKQFLDNIHTLVHQAHKAASPVVYVQHSGERILLLGSPGWQLHPKLSPLPEDLHIDKTRGSAFENTLLAEMLEARQVGTVVICGLVTHGCVRATCQGALQLGYQVIVAGDAHSSFSKDAAKLIKQWNAKLEEAGAEARQVAEIEFEG